MKTTIWRESTEVPVQRSLQSISEMLAAAGAKSINQQFEDGRPIGVSFTLVVNKMTYTYALPVRPEAILRALKEKSARSTRRKDPKVMAAQAERIAWRQLFGWIEAQLGMIDCGMLAAGEVFLPYLLATSGQTLWQTFQQKQLTEG
jgi:hypothetical protein